MDILDLQCKFLKILYYFELLAYLTIHERALDMRDEMVDS